MQYRVAGDGAAPRECNPEDFSSRFGRRCQLPVVAGAVTPRPPTHTSDHPRIAWRGPCGPSPWVAGPALLAAGSQGCVRCSCGRRGPLRLSVACWEVPAPLFLGASPRCSPSVPFPNGIVEGQQPLRTVVPTTTTYFTSPLLRPRSGRPPLPMHPYPSACGEVAVTLQELTNPTL